MKLEEYENIENERLKQRFELEDIEYMLDIALEEEFYKKLEQRNEIQDN